MATYAEGKQLVFQYLRENGWCSRAQIIGGTNLAHNMVQRILEEWGKLGYIQVDSDRKPWMFNLNAVRPGEEDRFFEPFVSQPVEAHVWKSIAQAFQTTERSVREGKEAWQPVELMLLAAIGLMHPDIDVDRKREISPGVIEAILTKCLPYVRAYQVVRAIQEIPIRDRSLERYGILQHDPETAEQIWNIVSQVTNLLTQTST